MISVLWIHGSLALLSAATAAVIYWTHANQLEQFAVLAMACLLLCAILGLGWLILILRWRFR